MRKPSRPMFLPLLIAAACGGKGEEENPLSADGKADTLRSPTRKGTLATGAQRRAELRDDEAFHAWTFLVSDAADVKIELSPGDEGNPVDTVLYLYQRNQDGNWGRFLVKNDDGGDYMDGGFSAIEMHLEPGQYRIVVKGFAAQDRGEYGVTASGFSTDCAFGATFGDLDDQSPVAELSRKALTAADIPRLSEEDRARIIRALHVSTHDDVDTVEEAFEAADGGEINKITLVDEAGIRHYRAFEYGAGDNSFGAIFHEGAEPVAEIQDGDIAECQVTIQACLFGGAFDGFNSAGLLQEMSEDTLTPSSELSVAEAKQVLAAVDNADFQTAAEAIEAVDEAQMTVTEYQDPRDGKRYRYYHFYSGDTPVGAAFEGNGAVPVLVMGDGEFTRCERFY